MLDILYKKACGYVIKETTEEYGIDENGNERLVKKKVHSKYIPPDMTAIKAYLQESQQGLSQMSEVQLQKEKKRLLQELTKIQKQESKK